MCARRLLPALALMLATPGAQAAGYYIGDVGARATGRVAPKSGKSGKSADGDAEKSEG